MTLVNEREANEIYSETNHWDIELVERFPFGILGVEYIHFTVLEVSSVPDPAHGLLDRNT